MTDLSKAISAIRAKKQDASQGTSQSQVEGTLLLDDIKDRLEGDTRPLNQDHVVALAESIAAMGLIEPLVIDNKGRLLAGGHRRAAIHHLKENNFVVYTEQFPDNRIPIRLLDFDSKADPERALEVEVTENERRRDYTPSEVRQLADRLRKAGYTDKPGRPKEGEQRLRPALEIIVGKSLKTIQRYLKEPENEETRTDVQVLRSRQIKRAINALKEWRETNPTSRKEKELLNQLPEILAALNSVVDGGE